MSRDYDITLRGKHLDILYGFYFAGRKDVIFLVAQNDHGQMHAENIIHVFKKITQNNIRVKIVETVDSTCKTCEEKVTRKCKEFIPYGESAAAADRGAMHHYGFVKRIYTSQFILNRIKEKGPCLRY